MGYLQPAVRPGYNTYLSIRENPEVGMDVGLLVLKKGQTFQGGQTGQETAVLLLEGSAEFI